MTFPTPQPLRRVAILAHTEFGYLRGVIRGIRQFVLETNPGWVLRLFAERPEAVAELLTWQPDGLLLHLDAGCGAQLQSLWPQSVTLFADYRDRGIPMVTQDEAAFGQMAAQFFLERGFRRFVFVTEERGEVEKFAGFAAPLAAAGFSCACVRLIQDDDCKRLIADSALLERLFAADQSPVAVWVSDDIVASEFLRLCHERNWPVPGRIAVLGTNNDDLICDFAEPPLSTIVQPSRRIGYEAAALLARRLAGEAVPERVALPPLSVLQRESTDTVPTADGELRKAVDLLVRAPQEALEVGDLLARTTCSRRSLEQRFRRAFNNSPGRHMRRLKLEQARDLLIRTSLSVKDIAAQCGFPTPRALARALLKADGLSPVAYRQSRS